jgi:hypothetical protein
MAAPTVAACLTRHVVFTVLPLRARPPYCLQRHTHLLHGCLATVVNKRYIAYSMHVTIFIQIYLFSFIGNTEDLHTRFPNLLYHYVSPFAAVPIMFNPHIIKTLIKKGVH